MLSREAAHGLARVVRVRGDQAGREIMAALIAEVARTPSVQVLESVMAVGLQTRDGRVTGVALAAADGSSGPMIRHGAACLLAGGGSGGAICADHQSAAHPGAGDWHGGVAGAVISDAESGQFHPHPAIDIGEDPAPLATEALRGEGAVLITVMRARFMLAVHPDAELAPRDVVAR